MLRALGSRAAYVVHGADGLDELSTTGVNRISALRDGAVTTFDFDPATAGLARASLDDFPVSYTHLDVYKRQPC